TLNDLTIIRIIHAIIRIISGILHVCSPTTLQTCTSQHCSLTQPMEPLKNTSKKNCNTPGQRHRDKSKELTRSLKVGTTTLTSKHKYIDMVKECNTNC